MSKNQKIYKKYIGKIEELKKLKKWMMQYNYTIKSMLINPNDEKKIKTSLKKLEINYKHKKNRKLLQSLDIEQLNKIFIDFIDQYNLLCGNSYESFREIENDKLILLNIVEKYFSFIESAAKDKFSNRFYKQTIYKLSGSILPKSNKRKMLDKYLQNFSYYAYYFVIAIILTLIIMLLLTGCLHCLGFNPTKESDQVISIVFSLLLSGIISAIILIGIDKPLNCIILPKKKIAFARDESEKQSFLSIVSVIISIISLFISVTFSLS